MSSTENERASLKSLPEDLCRLVPTTWILNGFDLRHHLQAASQLSAAKNTNYFTSNIPTLQITQLRGLHKLLSRPTAIKYWGKSFGSG